MQEPTPDSLAFLVHSRYVASEQTAKKTPLPTILVLLRVYALPQKYVYGTAAYQLPSLLAPLFRFSTMALTRGVLALTC
jgi:hypothetical protein